MGNRLGRCRFGVSLGLLPGYSYFHARPGKMRAECKLNMLDVTVVFLKVARGIHFEYH
jgi:hypothetical protein